MFIDRLIDWLLILFPLPNMTLYPICDSGGLDQSLKIKLMTEIQPVSICLYCMFEQLSMGILLISMSEYNLVLILDLVG